MIQAGMLAAALLVITAAAAAQGGDSWKQLYEQAAKDHTFKCFGESDARACRLLISGIERAMAAPDADASVRHGLYREFLNAQAVYGKDLRERGDLDESRAVLERGYQQMMAHYDGGKHFHALIDNLKLQSELIQTAVLQGGSDVPKLLETARDSSEALYGVYQEHATNENRLRLQQINLIGSEQLERDVAASLAAHAGALQKKGKKADATRHLDLAATAYERSEQWLRRSTQAGIQSSWDADPAVRLSALHRGLAELQLARGDRKAAAQAYLRAGAYSCAEVTPEAEATIKQGGIPSPEQWGAFNECKRAADGYLLASGELQRMVERQVDAMYREQMSLLEADLEPLVREQKTAQD